MYSIYESVAWTKPQLASFSTEYDEYEPCISPDGKRVNVAIYVDYKGEKGTLDVRFDDTTFADFLARTAD